MCLLCHFCKCKIKWLKWVTFATHCPICLFPNQQVLGKQSYSRLIWSSAVDVAEMSVSQEGRRPRYCWTLLEHTVKWVKLQIKAPKRQKCHVPLSWKELLCIVLTQWCGQCSVSRVWFATGVKSPLNNFHKSNSEYLYLWLLHLGAKCLFPLIYLSLQTRLHVVGSYLHSCLLSVQRSFISPAARLGIEESTLSVAADQSFLCSELAPL